MKKLFNNVGQFSLCWTFSSKGSVDYKNCPISQILAKNVAELYPESSKICLKSPKQAFLAVSQNFVNF